jgi:hypothetical protein
LGLDLPHAADELRLDFNHWAAILLADQEVIPFAPTVEEAV